MLEKLVHTGRTIPKHQVCVTFDCPDDIEITELDPKAITGWEDADCIVSRRAGDVWLQAGKTAILKVPSVVFDVERNALINPAHTSSARIRLVSIEAIRWDDRLFPPHG
jgi:RES domain-containing protein